MENTALPDTLIVQPRSCRDWLLHAGSEQTCVWEDQQDMHRQLTTYTPHNNQLYDTSHHIVVLVHHSICT